MATFHLAVICTLYLPFLFPQDPVYFFSISALHHVPQRSHTFLKSRAKASDSYSTGRGRGKVGSAMQRG